MMSTPKKEFFIKKSNFLPMKLEVRRVCDKNGKRQKNLHEVRESKMPAVLVECGFMDSATDISVILSDEFAENVAKNAQNVLKNSPMRCKIEVSDSCGLGIAFSSR